MVKVLGPVFGARNRSGRSMTAASDLLVEIFGDQGRHSRLAMGRSEVLRGSPLEVEMIVEVQESYNY
jgi:hypothetical protein